MGKESYHVSVQSKTVSETTDDTSYPFEILATSAELFDLKALLNLESDVDEAALVRMPITAYSSHPEESNQVYDTYFSRIYNKLYELGTLKTREHIEKMNILRTKEVVADEGQN